MYLHPGKLSLRLIPPKNSQRTWHFLILKFNRLYPHPPNAIQNSRRPHFQINQDSSGPIQIMFFFQNKHHFAKKLLVGKLKVGVISSYYVPSLFKKHHLPTNISPGFSPVTAIVFAVFGSSTTATWRATGAMALRKLRCSSDAAAPTVDPRREPEIAHVLKGGKKKATKTLSGLVFLCVLCLLMCVFSFWVWYLFIDGCSWCLSLWVRVENPYRGKWKSKSK